MHLRAENLHLTTVDDTTVALDTTTSEYLTLNAAGTLLFERLREDAQRTDLVDVLVQRYAIDPDLAGADVDVFLEQLRSRGLLEG